MNVIHGKVWEHHNEQQKPIIGNMAMVIIVSKLIEAFWPVSWVMHGMGPFLLYRSLFLTQFKTT